MTAVVLPTALWSTGPITPQLLSPEANTQMYPFLQPYTGFKINCDLLNTPFHPLVLVESPASDISAHVHAHARVHTHIPLSSELKCD